MEPLRILVCEDERLFALELKERLEKMGHRVVGTAHSGSEAVAMARNLQPQLALMDVKLTGGVAGTRVADALLKSFHVPSIFVTAFSDAETVSQAVRAHPLAYLVKPINDRDLELAIEIGMAQHAVEEDLREELNAYSTLLSRLGVAEEDGGNEYPAVVEQTSDAVRPSPDVSGIIGGIAQHIGRSLALVMENLDRLSLCSTLGAHEQRHVKAAREACYDQKLFVQRLLWAVQEGPRDLAVERVSDLISQVMLQVERLKRPGVSIEARGDGKEMALFVDVEALRSALVGVLLFAQQLVSGQGTVTLSVESEYISAANLKNPRATPDSFVVIEVRSSGREMTNAEIHEALLPHGIKEGDAQALGLALAVAHGVTQAHGGWLTVESKKGAGTAITLFLPRVHSS